MEMPEGISKEDIEFEIAFYNGLIDKQPDFAEALIALGELYTAIGLYREGLAVDEKLIQLRPDDPIVHYNCACSYSILGEIDKAFRSVKKAINCGYCDFEHMEQDTDLKNLREDARFKKLLVKARKKYGDLSLEQEP